MQRMSKSALVQVAPVSETQVGFAPVVLGGLAVQLEKQLEPLAAAQVMIVETQVGVDEKVVEGHATAHHPAVIFPTEVSHEPDCERIAEEPSQLIFARSIFSPPWLFVEMLLARRAVV